MDHSEVKHLPKVDHAPAELDEPAKLLMAAADVLENGGHCKAILYYGDTHCVNGAILRASGWLPSYNWPSVKSELCANEALQRLRVGLGLLRCEERRDSWRDTAAWNNRPERTQAEVVAKLRAVALGL